MATERTPPTPRMIRAVEAAGNLPAFSVPNMDPASLVPPPASGTPTDEPGAAMPGVPGAPGQPGERGPAGAPGVALAPLLGVIQSAVEKASAEGMAALMAGSPMVGSPAVPATPGTVPSAPEPSTPAAAQPGPAGVPESFRQAVDSALASVTNAFGSPQAVNLPGVGGAVPPAAAALESASPGALPSPSVPAIPGLPPEGSPANPSAPVLPGSVPPAQRSEPPAVAQQMLATARQAVARAAPGAAIVNAANPDMSGFSQNVPPPLSPLLPMLPGVPAAVEAAGPGALASLPAALAATTGAEGVGGVPRSQSGVRPAAGIIPGLAATLQTASQGSLAGTPSVSGMDPGFVQGSRATNPGGVVSRAVESAQSAFDGGGGLLPGETQSPGRTATRAGPAGAPGMPGSAASGLEGVRDLVVNAQNIYLTGAQSALGGGAGGAGPVAPGGGEEYGGFSLNPGRITRTLEQAGGSASRASPQMVEGLAGAGGKAATGAGEGLAGALGQAGAAGEGGALAAGGSAAGAGAAAGPIGMALAVAAEGAYKAGKAFLELPGKMETFADGVLGSSKTLRDYNAAIGVALAQMEAAGVGRNIRVGENTAGTTTQLAASLTGLKEAMVPQISGLSNFSGGLAALGARLGELVALLTGPLFDALGTLGKLLAVLAQTIGEAIKDNRTTFGAAVRSITDANPFLKALVDGTKSLDDTLTAILNKGLPDVTPFEDAMWNASEGHGLRRSKGIVNPILRP